MTIAEILKLVGEFGTWVVFLALYLKERQRNVTISEARVKELIDCQQQLVAILETHHQSAPQPRPE